MNTDPSHPHLSRIHQEIESVIQDVEQNLSGLNRAQFNWKPAPKSWSIAECMKHLLIVYGKYRPQLVKKVAGIPSQEIMAPYQSSFFGRVMMGFVNPDKFKKTPAPGMLRPKGSSDYDLSVRTEYLSYLNEVNSFVEKADGLNLNKIKINSSVGSIIRFNLGDYFEIESMHNRRHVAQMKRVKAQDGFPKA